MAVQANQKVQCWKCNGTGKFYAGGAVVNGVYTGRVGPCYGCQGKGFQTPSDRKRNTYYWRMNAGRYA